MSSSSHYLTEAFILNQDTAQSPVEIWLDWIPLVDDAPELGIQAWREDDDLLIQTQGVETPRRLVALDAITWTGLTEQGGVIVVCGPSGELGRRAFRLENAKA